MAASIVDYRQQVNDGQISFSEALLKLTDKEIAYQQHESLKRRITRARFPIIKRLSDFDYQFQPSINQQQIAEFATMSFLDNQENIIFIGSPGVGKTHLSIGLGIEACQQGVRTLFTLFINCHELILRLKAAQEKQHLERVMRRYERYDLLIIDELGYLPISANEAKLLFQLINGRYERKSTIITTNVPLSSWGTVLHSTATAEAILDRLVYHSHVIKIKGKSYRLASVNS
jgi:DNA replication protein DnaC